MSSLDLKTLQKAVSGSAAAFRCRTRLQPAVLVQRLLRCSFDDGNGLYSRIIPRFSGIKPGLFLENVMPPGSIEFSSVSAPTQFRRFATTGNCSKSPEIS